MVQSLEGIEPPVQVYVRKADTDGFLRTLSFNMPAWLSQGEALDKGWAIDGNSVLVTVSKKDLLTIEREIVSWFRQKGHGITFC